MTENDSSGDQTRDANATVEQEFFATSPAQPSESHEDFSDMDQGYRSGWGSFGLVAAGLLVGSGIMAAGIANYYGDDLKEGQIARSALEDARTRGGRVGATTLTIRNADLTQRVDEVRRENDGLKAQLDDAQAVVGGMAAQVEHYRQQLESQGPQLNAELARLGYDRSAALHDVAELGQRLSLAQGLLRAAQNYRDNDIAGLQQSNAVLTDYVAMLEEAYNQLGDRLDIAESDNRAVTVGRETMLLGDLKERYTSASRSLTIANARLAAQEDLLGQPASSAYRLLAAIQAGDQAGVNAMVTSYARGTHFSVADHLVAGATPDSVCEGAINDLFGKMMMDQPLADAAYAAAESQFAGMVGDRCDPKDAGSLINAKKACPTCPDFVLKF